MRHRGPDSLDNDSDFVRSKVHLLGHNSLTLYEIKSYFCKSKKLLIYFSKYVL